MSDLDDRALLESAARAAGYEIEPHPNRGICSDLVFSLGGRTWNPLIDDGDALRLAVALNLSIRFDSCPDGVGVNVGGEWDGAPPGVQEVFDKKSSANATTRRAIVRAAAEIGKGMGDE